MRKDELREETVLDMFIVKSRICVKSKGYEYDKLWAKEVKFMT